MKARTQRRIDQAMLGLFTLLVVGLMVGVVVVVIAIAFGLDIGVPTSSK